MISVGSLLMVILNDDCVYFISSLIISMISVYLLLLCTVEESAVLDILKTGVALVDWTFEMAISLRLIYYSYVL